MNRGSNSQAIHFVSLGADVILRILVHLHPACIISLRHTCRALYHLTKLRTVWTHAVRSVLGRFSIPEAIFPTGTFTLPLLEHIALAPHRLLSLLSSSQGAPILPFTIRVLSPRLTSAEKEKYEIFANNGIYDSCVEETGRYMATLTDYVSFTLITVWDLGICGSDAIKAIARYSEAAPLTLYLDGFCAGPHASNTFYLFSTHESSVLLPMAVLVHQFDPSHSSKISFLARLNIASNDPLTVARVYPVPGTYKVVINYEDDMGRIIFWVWDFIRDLVAALVVEDCPLIGNEPPLCYDDCIMIASEGCLSIYNIPPLLPRNLTIVPSNCEAKITVVPPSRIPNSAIIGYKTTVPTMPSYILSFNPSKLEVFEVTNSNESHNPKLPNKLPAIIISSGVADHLLGDRDYRSSADLLRCEDHLLLFGFGNLEPGTGDAVIFASNIRGQSSNQVSRTVLSNPVNRQDIKVFRFCPLLGRFIVHSREHAIHRVYILDYLASPAFDVTRLATVRSQ